MPEVARSEITVVKYGGMCLATADRIREIAHHLCDRILSGEQLVIVVSAMGKSTDQLIALARTVSQTPDRRELDMLISTGERVSMALVSMALNDALKSKGSDRRAISLTGSQAGVLTNEVHSQARIVEIKPSRVQRALQSGSIVILAGFQGVSEVTKEITTLGRGGSDLTAVAMSVALRAKQCEIVKEVPGIMSDDPARFQSAALLHDLDYRTLCAMTYWGAKVLHRRAADVAQQNGIRLVVRKVGLLQGTVIKMTQTSAHQGDKMLEHSPTQLIATTEQIGVLRFDFSSSDSSRAATEFSQVLRSAGIIDVQIVMIQSFDDKVSIFAWGEQDLLTDAKLALTSQGSLWSTDTARYATTTFHFDGMVTAEDIQRAYSGLKNRSKDVHTGPKDSVAPTVIATLTSSHSVTLLHKD